MVTAKSLPIFVLAIGGLAVLGCGSQRQVPDDVTHASNQSSSRIDPVAEPSDVAAVSGSSAVGDLASSGAQQRTTQFTIPNPRQHVLSSGFPARSY